jgi:hypothetical protein
MKVSYFATQAEMTELSQLLLKRHRGQISVRFTEEGVEAEVETESPVPAANRDEAFEIVSSELRCAA